MKNIIITALIILSSCFIIENTVSQTIVSDTSELSDYFIDNTTDSKNIIKIGFTSLLAGDLPFFYERKFSKQFSIEAGVGKILSFYVFEASDVYVDEQIITDPDGGYSIWLQPKYYFWRAPEDMYFGIQYRFRKYLQGGYAIKYSDYTVNYGYQWIIGKHFVLDANVGVGFRIRNIPDDFNEWGYEYNKTIIVIPGGISFGILF